MVMWWERVAKKQIRLLFIREGTEKSKDDREMENVYLACLDNLLQDPTHQAMRAAKENLLKAKLVKLYSARLASGTIDLQSPEIFQEEQMSLFHLIKRRTRREQRTIPQVKDPSGGIQTSMKGIMDTFNACMKQKYGPVQVDEDCVMRMAGAGH